MRGRAARAAAIGGAYRSCIRRATLVVYVSLVVLAVILAPLLIEDVGLDLDATGMAGWYSVAVAVFVSGVYWTQAVIVVAIEAARVGEPPPPARTILRRAAERTNALTVALVLLVALAGVSIYTLFALLLLVARFTLVVPVLELEKTSVLGAFRRSWHLTAGRTWRTFGLMLSNGLLITIAFSFTLGIASGIVTAATADSGAAVYVGASAATLLAAAIPTSMLLAHVGTSWSLLYYDLRRGNPVPGA
jgi:hypothetical protein